VHRTDIGNNRTARRRTIHPLVGFLPLILLIFVTISCAPSRELLYKRGRSLGVDGNLVRVLILKVDDRLTVSSHSKLKIAEIKSREIRYAGRGGKIHFYPEMVKNSLSVESWPQPIIVNGNRYRGHIELHNVLGKIYVINVLQLDEYLFGVVPSEIMSTWPMEALKAQAVTARTYAYYHIMKKKNLIYDLDSTTRFQVYRGLTVETEPTNRAVRETSGEIITYKNQPIIAYFHSTCGGHTVDDRFVWEGNDLEYLRGVTCKYCRESPAFSWDTELTLHEIRRFLKKKYHGIGRIIGITLKKRNGRVVFVVVRHSSGVVRIKGNDFRLLFPGKKIRSLLFAAEKTKNGLILHGHGWGHGVGMCQWGAKGLAERGADYRSILRYYYKNISIVSFKPDRVKREPLFTERKKFRATPD